MRYLCVHCDERFELGPDQEPRCPKCLRLGPRALGDEPEPVVRPGRAQRWLGLAFLGALAAIALGGYLWTQQRQAESEPAAPAGEPLEPGALARELERRAVPAEGLERLLAPDAAVERFAEAAARGKTGATDQARAITQALRARAAAQAFTPWSLSEPRPESPRTASATLAAIAKDGARKQLYPLELAALGVAALRALDVPAMLAEVRELPGARAPLDPSGRLGYFAVALKLAGKPEPQLFDPYGGREPFAATGAVVLNDVEAVGAALSLRAGARLARNEDPAAALRDADLAVKLLPTSATVRTARGTVLLANAASELGESELQAAVQMAPDPPRRNNLAMLYLAKGDGERAAREVSQALSAQPDFALARITLAAVYMARAEREQAAAELQKADALEPELPALALAWAQYHASGGEIEQAIGQVQRALRMRPKDPQTRLLLAGIYRQAGRYDEMRAEARTALALAPAALQPRMRELIGRLLGPTALEESTAAEAAPSGSAPAQAGRLELDKPGASAEPRLRLLPPGGEPSAPSTGTLKAQDGAPTLRLKEPGTGLTLHNP